MGCAFSPLTCLPQPCRWPPPSTTWLSSMENEAGTGRRSPCANVPWKSERRSRPPCPAPVPCLVRPFPYVSEVLFCGCYLDPAVPLLFL